MTSNKNQHNNPPTLSKSFETHDELQSFLLFVSNTSQRLQQFPKVTHQKLDVTLHLEDGMKDLAKEVDTYFKSKNNDVNRATKVSTAVLYCDGGSRGNPGPAASGYVILDESGKRIAEGGEYLGETTNNQAEYQSLAQGMERALDMGVRKLSAYMDSQLAVRQVLGQYKVRHEGILPIYRRVIGLVERFDDFTIDHVLRGDNQEADAMVNKILDKYSTTT